jgi:EAL domain-containing protein (putative c-di-GMP-specific phosphodiesterase class I)
LQNKHQLQLEGELRRAIEREEFVLHYQPKVDVRSGFVIGAETLVRWQHPTRGIVPPNEFISLAEDAGLIGAIGDWVLSTACRQNAIWHSEGLGLQLAVNVSGNQFQTREFVRQVRIALEESGLPPHFLTLELTESVVVEDAKHNIEILHALKELGIKLSVDDFGTGYSSLSYLEQFPLDELKVDRAFISKIDAATGDAPIVSALIAMAHSLRFIVVAEGVETSHQLDFLSRHKCEQYQGYLFSKPLPADDFAALAVNWRPVRI